MNTRVQFCTIFARLVGACLVEPYFYTIKDVWIDDMEVRLDTKGSGMIQISWVNFFMTKNIYQKI